MAGGLFHFKKDHAQYSLKPDDYETKPLFVASKENRLLNEFFLYVLEDLHTCQSLGALQFTSDDPTFVKEKIESFYRLIPATAKSPRDATNQGLLAAAHCLPHCLSSRRSVLQGQRRPDFRRLR